MSFSQKTARNGSRHIFVTSSEQTLQHHGSSIQRSPGVIDTTPAEGINQVTPNAMMGSNQTAGTRLKIELNKLRRIFVTSSGQSSQQNGFDNDNQRSPGVIDTTPAEGINQVTPNPMMESNQTAGTRVKIELNKPRRIFVTSSGQSSQQNGFDIDKQSSPGVIDTTPAEGTNQVNPNAVMESNQTAGTRVKIELNKPRRIFVTSSGQSSQQNGFDIDKQSSPGVIDTTPAEGTNQVNPNAMMESNQTAGNRVKIELNKPRRIFVTSSGQSSQQDGFDNDNQRSPGVIDTKSAEGTNQVTLNAMIDIGQKVKKHVDQRTIVSRNVSPDSIKQIKLFATTENKSKLSDANDVITLQDLDEAYAASMDNQSAEYRVEYQRRELNINPDSTQTEKSMNKESEIITETTKDIDKDRESVQEDKKSLETITLPKNINLTYSRYNGKKKANKKNAKPGRINADEKGKTKSKKSKKNLEVDQDEESYHIAMAGHMPQAAITDAFSGTGDLKQTIKKENKAEILARLKKGSIYKLFHKPTKVKKFKVKKEKTENSQNKPNTIRGIRKSIHQFIGDLRDSFRACRCF